MISKRLSAAFISAALTAVLLAGCAAPAAPASSSVASSAGSSVPSTSAESVPAETPAVTPTSAPAETPTPAPTEEPAPDPSALASAAKAFIEEEGYADIRGKQYSADILHSEALAAYMHAGAAPFDKGYLGYAIDDFDLDGTEDALFVTIEKDQIC